MYLEPCTGVWGGGPKRLLLGISRVSRMPPSSLMRRPPDRYSIRDSGTKQPNTEPMTLARPPLLDHSAYLRGLVHCCFNRLTLPQFPSLPSVWSFVQSRGLLAA